MNVPGDISLSVCIPVYNCGEFISHALDSILSQITDDVEVIVYDGGSTDDTPSVMSAYLEPTSPVRYHRAAARGGIDADLAACVAMAQGAYCWLFSGDDVMRAGALQAAARWMESGHDVYLCEHTLCDRDMRFHSTYPVLNPNVAFAAELADSAMRRDWFRRAVSTEAFFSFMSTLIVRRSTWLDGRLIPEFDGSCWAHVARLFERIPRGLLIAYVGETWLDQRGGNDSFRDSGIVRRYALAIDGFERIAGHFFGRSSAEAFHIRRVLRFEFSLRMFLDAKLLCAENPGREDRAMLDRLVDAAYNDPSPWLLVSKWTYRLTPLWSLRCARYLLGRSRRRGSR